MKARIIKIAGLFLGIFVIALPAFADECKLDGIGRKVTIEKGFISHPNIKPVNAVIRTTYLGQSKEIAEFSVPNISKNPYIKNLPADALKNLKNPKDIAVMLIPTDPSSWATILIPTVFTANVKLINGGE